MVNSWIGLVDFWINLNCWLRFGVEPWLFEVFAFWVRKWFSSLLYFIFWVELFTVS